ncbi:hypothetical protein NZK27_13150, partial [Synechococcus sp. FGCU-3]|nr:hypothetical protein [Synechococcus sp. FGCU3]
ACFWSEEATPVGVAFLLAIFGQAKRFATYDDLVTRGQRSEAACPRHQGLPVSMERENVRDSLIASCPSGGPIASG